MSLIARASNSFAARRAGYHSDARAAVAAARNLGAAVSGGGAAALGGRYTQSRTHHADQYGYFSGYPYAIINTIANRLAAQPIRVARRMNRPSLVDPSRRVKRDKSGVPLLPKHLHEDSDRLEIIPNHRINRVIDNPNPIMVRHHLLYATFASVEITGRGYWWMFDDPESATDQIWPIPSHWIEPVHTDEKVFDHYKLIVPTSGLQLEVPARQIVPFFMSDPADPFGALAPMQAMARTVMTDFAFEMAQRMSMENGINPGLAIIVGKPPDVAGVGGDQVVLTEDQRAQLVAAVRRQYRGVTKFDEPMILDALIKDVKPIFPTPKEMAFRESGTLVRNRLAQGWSMNPITLGEIEGVNYASSGVADHHVCRAVYAPRSEVTSQTLTCYVPKYFKSEGEDLVVYQEPPTPNDPQMEMDRDYGDYDRGLISRNEMRQRRGMGRIDKGDRALTQTGWVRVEAEGEGTGKRRKPPGSKVTDAHGQEHDENGRFGSGGSGGAHKPHSEGGHGTGSVDDSDKEHAERARGFKEKLKKYGKKAVAAAGKVAEKLKYVATEISFHVMAGNLAEDICDTSNDYAKIINAKGTGDWLSTNLGVSGGFAAKVGAIVLNYAFTKLKQYAAKKRRTEGDEGKSRRPAVKGRKGKKEKEKQEHLTIGEAAHHVTSINRAIWSGLGCPEDELPSRKEVEKWLLKQHNERLGGGDEGKEDDKEDDDKAAAPVRFRRAGSEWVKRAAEQVDERQTAAEGYVREALEPVLHKLGASAAARLRDALSHGNAPSAEDAAHVAIDRDEWEKLIEPALKSGLAAGVMAGALLEWEAFRAHHTGRRAARLDPDTRAELRSKSLPGRFFAAARRAVDSVIERGYTRTLVDGVLGAVRAAVERYAGRGQTGRELADSVASHALTGTGAEKTAEAAARSEGATAVNSGQHSVRAELARTGAVAVTEWVTQEDEKVRASHRRMNGRRVRPGKAFDLSGYSCYYPGDAGLPPGERKNCRCKCVTVYAQ